MTSRHTRKLAVAVLLAGCAVFAMSKPAGADQKNDIRKAYIESFGERNSGTVILTMSRLFQELDPEGNGITEENIGFVEKLTTAQVRASAVGSWLPMDLDGDLRISRDEVTSLTMRHGQRQVGEKQKKRFLDQQSKHLNKLFEADKDGNGFIEGAEFFNSPEKSLYDGRREFASTSFARELLKADPNDDGILTQTEAMLLATQALEGVDEEIFKSMEEAEGKRALGMRPQCPKVEVSKDSDVILFGSYESNSLSNLTIAGQDEETHGTTIFIEDGTKPLSVFVSSYHPMIWKFTGATQCISKIVAFGGWTQSDPEAAKAAAGVVGIERSKIQFVPGGLCLQPFNEAQTREALAAQAVVEYMSGRKPDKVWGQYGISIASLPSGSGLKKPDEEESDEIREEATKQLIAKAGVTFFTLDDQGKLVPLNQFDKEANRSQTEQELLRFSPDGLMKFEQSEVVSEVPVEAYEVYPQHAGLLQLQAQGKITRRSDEPGLWKINEAIRFPTGLAGSLSTTFFLPKGVPAPKGDPGHSCVYVEQNDGKIEPSGDICS
jgi:hypothetical protein